MRRCAQFKFKSEVEVDAHVPALKVTSTFPFNLNSSRNPISYLLTPSRRGLAAAAVMALALTAATAKAALNAGDIAFVMYNADATPDTVAFVALVDIPAGEEIKFTDNGWLSTNVWRTGEGIHTYTAPIGGVSKGSVVTVSLDATGFTLSTSGDQIIAYQGTATMISALNNDGSGVWQDNATDSNTSALPQGLTNGTTAVAINETDNARYNGTLSGTKAELLAAINNNANWDRNDSAVYTWTLGSFTVGSAATAPSSQAASFTSSSVTSSGATVGWTRGNGTGGVLVVARASGAVDADPTDGTTYTANAAFGSGTQIGTGNYVVYKGTGTSVNVTGLSASTAYHFAIYEYNTSGLMHNMTELTGNVTTLPASTPTLTPVTLGSALTATYPSASSGVSFTAAGTNLTENITVTAQSGYEVSTSSGSGYANSVSVATGTTVYVRFAASRNAGEYNNGTAAVLSGGGASSNANITTSISGNTISKATPSISVAPTASTITYGQTLANSTLTGGTASVAGSFAFTTAATAPNAGTANQGVTFTPTDTTNYNTTTTNVSVTVNKANQTISGVAATSTQPTGITYALNATVNSGLTLTYSSSDTGVATVNASGIVTSLAVGTSTLTVSQAGDSNYNPATSVTQALTVTRGELDLSGTNYTQNFDSIGSGLPTGWRVRTGATSSARGTGGSFTPTTNVWTNVSGAFKNFASADGGDSTDDDATQNARTDRSLGIRQTSSFGDSGAAFELTLANTTDKTGFNLSLKHQMLSVQTRSTTWSVQHSTNGTSWTTAGTYVDPGQFGSTNSTFNLGTALDNKSGPVYIRIVALDGSTGSGNRDSYGIDDFELSWSNPPPSITIGGNTSATATAFITTYGTPSGNQSFTIAGSYLTADISVGAVTGFEYSIDGGSTWGTTRTITQSSGSASATLLVRLSATAAVSGSYNSQNIVLSSTGATSVNIVTAASGNAVTKATPTITAAPTASAITYGQTLASSTLTGGTGSVAGSFAFTSPSTAPSAGTASQGVTFTPADTTNYNTAATTVSVTVTAAALPAVTWGTSTISNSNGVASFSYLYTGRNSNAITTTYSNSAVPTAAGYYTAVATSTDANYSGSSTNTYFVAGPVAGNDAVIRPTNNTTFLIPRATLLQNDQRIHTNGTVLSNSLSITGVAAGTGGPTVNTNQPAFISFTAGGSGVETFTYTLADAVTGLTTTGTVTVTPEADQAMESFSIAGSPGTPAYDGFATKIKVNFTGTPNTTYTIYFTTDLDNGPWQNGGGWWSGSTGTFEAEFWQEGNHTSAWGSIMFFKYKK